MRNQISLDVTSPCSENYTSFKPTPNGGFCNMCTKEVIDFTTMTAQETIAYFKKNSSTNTCGRFKSHQLKTYKVPSKKSKRLSFFKWYWLSMFISIFFYYSSRSRS